MRQLTLLVLNTTEIFGGLNSATQVTRDVEALYGALQTACKKRFAKNILLKYEKISNGVAVWQDLIEEFGNDGDKESRIANLEDVVTSPQPNKSKNKTGETQRSQNDKSRIPAA